MEIRHEDGGRQGRFAADTEAGTAELTWRRLDETTVAFDHTFVPTALRGQGVAAKLLDAAVAWAREAGVKVVPQCSYVRAEFARKAAYRDIAA
ncbi:GNAT family N-acetyltransferase [Mangrovicella endophytica]|uniref:GNAT family N-acetyltransferase n=1 Tax=Mangrovicella endophytica TaxID=2066697 RepID=UPI000C9EB074|nr:GNAT family N-acetyltransferase [Mangrovicella endophytica]